MDVTAIASAANAANSARQTPKEVAAQFESLLLTQMFNAMQSTVEKSGLLDGGSAEEMYQEMLNQALADAVAKGGGLGLSKHLERQIKAYTETAEAVEG